mmetsp:Transcript_8143/g.24168  ORF Transcript_8143/g.24168 Transcript_8143/m.24168 type:complete len:203 (-) Transcript_8143:2103-2711(-)
MPRELPQRLGRLADAQAGHRGSAGHRGESGAGPGAGPAAARELQPERRTHSSAAQDRSDAHGPQRRQGEGCPGGLEGGPRAVGPPGGEGPRRPAALLCGAVEQPQHGRRLAGAARAGSKAADAGAARGQQPFREVEQPDARRGLGGRAGGRPRRGRRTWICRRPGRPAGAVGATQGHDAEPHGHAGRLLPRARATRKHGHGP